MSKYTNMIRIDKMARKPLVSQLETALRQAILKGEYKPGELLPGFRELSRACEVSEKVSRQALARLAQDGWISQRRGVGSVVVDAVLKGFPDIDRALAYEAVTNSLTVGHVESTGRPKRKENWDLYDRYGYYPYDLIPGESVSRTLECAYDDACAVKFAALVGDEKGRAFFARRAGNWRNVLDLSLGLVRGKDSKGVWREPFDPYRFGGGGEWEPYDCTEGNTFQYTWHVFQDPLGLIATLGGGEFVLGAPQLPEVALSLPGGKTLRTVACGLSRTNKYVRRMMLEGHPVEGFKLRYADLMKGGTLVFEMKGVAR